MLLMKTGGNEDERSELLKVHPHRAPVLETFASGLRHEEFDWHILNGCRAQLRLDFVGHNLSMSPEGRLRRAKLRGGGTHGFENQ